MFYAGIGTHKDTPENILVIMNDIASHLGSNGWTLRSGGAAECDTAFELGADRVNGAKEIYLPWSGYNHNKSKLSGDNYPFSPEEMDFTARMHPRWDRCAAFIRKLHARNTRIVVGLEAIHGPQVTPVKFGVCYTKNGKTEGGTGQGIRIMKALNIPVINLGEPKSPMELEALVLSIETLQQNLRTK